LKYISYEIKKILGIKYLWIFLAVLLAVNSGIAFYTARCAQPQGITSREIAEFYELYFSNTAEMEEYYAGMRSWQEEQQKLFLEAMQSGNRDYEGEQWVNRYAPDGYSDQALFARVYASIGTAKSYSSDMQKVINRAKANLTEFRSMGISENSYTYKYQQRVIGIYEHLRDNVKIGVEYTHGWGNYFDYDIVNIFIFVILIMFGSVIFAQEKVSGFLPIVRTARCGRARTAFAKIAVMGFFTVGIVLLFTLTTWGIFGIELGYSSPSNAIQAFGEFTYCQYIITVGQYFAITIAVRILTFLVFSAILLALSVFVYNYAVIYAAGLGFFGLNFLLYTLSYLNADNPFKNLNFVSAAAVNPLFVRFRSINFFGGVWGYISFMMTVFGILTVAGIIVTAFVFIKRYANGVSFARARWLGARIIRRRSAIKARAICQSARVRAGQKAHIYTRKLVLYEMYKTLISSRFLLIVLALLCVKIYFFSDIYKAKNSFSDAVYKEYMTMLEGELTEEKSQYIAGERAFINDTKAKYETMRSEYINGKITLEEYRDYMEDYNYACSRDEYFKIIEAHEAYLHKTEEKTGTRAWFLYDTGWKKLINTGADLYLFASILLLFAGSFADEYSSRSSSGSFVQILRTTKKGRVGTFRAKMASTVIITLIISIIFNSAEFIIILKNYDTPSMSAPILSIEQFGDINAGTAAGMTIVQYIILMYSLRVLAALLLALAVTGLSEILRKHLPVMSATAVLTLVPALLSYFGLSAADKVNFLNFFGGTQLFLNSAAGDFIGNDFGTLIIFAAACILITQAAFIRAYATYTGE
jgi:hypothetical protein